MNIAEVAHRAGVSRSTVSYVLSGKRQVTEATRQRVLRVIDEVGYRPSAVARSLRHGETRTLGLVVPPLRHRLSAEQLHFVGAVADAAADHDYDILLSPSGGDREAAFDKLIGERRVDGIVLMETDDDDVRARKLAASAFPFVTIGRTGSDAHSWVDIDFSGVIAAGVRRLHALGHRRMALINRPQELLDREYGPAVRAREGFQRASAELGVAGASLCCDDLPAAARLCVERLYAGCDTDCDTGWDTDGDTDGPGPTAILTINGQALAGVLFGLRERGLSVPADVSVLAVASARAATSVQPQVSSADVPAEEMGRHAVETLLRLLADPAAPLAHILLAPPFDNRGSVAAPRRNPKSFSLMVSFARDTHAKLTLKPSPSARDARP
ncbi:MAG: LacI family DNA-binding transcriptional regulator [Trebonia sp.]